MVVRRERKVGFSFSPREIMKIKSINPSLREKKRYLAYEILSAKPLGKDMSTQVIVHAKRTLGLFDSAGAGLMHISYDTKHQAGIFKVKTAYVNKLRTALMLMDAETLGADAHIRTTQVSGTLKKLGRAG
jgi:ribonuclease P/MRP protein subunit POP5